MLQAIGLTKVYDDGVRALDALDLDLRSGEIYCLLGANGAGKTTTLHLFLDFIRPTAGKALVAGVEVARDPLAAKRHVAYVPETVTLYEPLTPLQHVELFARLYKKPPPARPRAAELLAEAGLDERTLSRRVRTFSKGMRQKLAIALAILKDAPALILDEPLSGLDPEAATLFVRTLEQLRAAGKTILMSTHDVFRARQLADRVGIMLAGRKVAELSHQEIAGEDLERLYLDYVQGDAGRDEP